MAKVCTPRQARITFVFIGYMLLVQFWGGAAMDLITGETIKFQKGSAPTKGDRGLTPGIFWGIVGEKVTLGVVLGGFFIALAQGIWVINLRAHRKDPAAYPLGDQGYSAMGIFVFCLPVLLLLVVLGYAYWQHRSA